MNPKTVAAWVIVAVATGGCAPEESFGYVQVVRQFDHADHLVFRLNGQTVEELRGSGTVVVRQKVGAAKLELLISGAVARQCSFELGKDRIVTVRFWTDQNRQAQCESKV